jgi:hypothetical protein
METMIDGIWVCFLIILLLGLADQDGGKKGRRVGFYWCSSAAFSSFSSSLPQEFFFLYLHIATRIGAGGFWLWLSLLRWSLGHVYTSAIRPPVYIPIRWFLECPVIPSHLSAKHRIFYWVGCPTLFVQQNRIVGATLVAQVGPQRRGGDNLKTGPLSRNPAGLGVPITRMTNDKD